MTKLFDTGFDLFHLKTPYYLPGSPVLVRTGMLQLDRLTSKVTIILELENISTQPLLSCTVQLTLYDAKNSPYEQVLTYSYEENQIKRGETFGKKNMISLPDDGVRSFSVMATHVVFPDDSEWTNTALFLPVTPRKTLKEEYQDSSLAEEFRIRYGRDCRYKPELFSDLWYCTCGAVNRQSDGNCYSCKRKLKALSSITKESLLQDSDVKIHAGKIKTDEYENLQEQGTYADDVTEELQENPQNDFEINTEPEKSAENQSGELPEQEHTDENSEPVGRKQILPAMQKRKLLSVSCFCFAAVILLFVCYITVVRPGKEHQKQYEAAEQLLADGAFSEAEEAFVSLGDYSDAREKAEEVPYKKALYILQCAENGDPSALRLFPEKNSTMDTEELKYFLHDQAKEQFSTMNNYRDSSAKLEEINAYFLEYEEKQGESEYQAAMTLMEKGKYLQARDAFQTMNGYKDSNNMVTECLYRRLCSILDVCQNNNMRGVKILLSDSSSAPTGIYIDDSALSSSREQIIDAVAVCFQEEGMKCREEGTEDSSADTVDAYEPICTVIAEKFKQLNGYRDSEDKAVQAGDSGNFVDEFYDLLKNGSLREAGNWLTYSKEGIPEADDLEKWIELYTPWEGTWGLLEGDTSLIPYSCGLKEGQVLVEFRAKVCIDNEKAVLHIEDPEGDYAVDLECDAGNTDFCRIEDGYYYYAKLTDPTVFLYMRYLENGTITSSCVYCK